MRLCLRHTLLRLGSPDIGGKNAETGQGSRHGCTSYRTHTNLSMMYACEYNNKNSVLELGCFRYKLVDTKLRMRRSLLMTRASYGGRGNVMIQNKFLAVMCRDMRLADEAL